jgi:iron complex transport system permease protein
VKRPPFWLLPVAAVVGFAACLLAGGSGLGLPPLDSPIFEMRLYRVGTGFVVGAALAVAGTLMQALLRNPLAEPYVLGVSSGAGLGAAGAILAARAFAVPEGAIPAAAFAAATLTLAIVHLLAREGGAFTVYSLLLAGVTVSAIASSLLMFLVAFAPIEGMHDILWWMLGNLDPASRGLFAASAAGIAVGLIIAFRLGRDLDALALGEEMAHHVGVRTRTAVWFGLGAATLLAASAVAVAGLIAFVGLIVPHAMRSMAGASHRRLLPAAALGGGLFLAVSDAVARVALMPREVPIGVITALIGGPFFLYLLRRRRRSEWNV